MSTAAIRILVVDDDADIARGTAHLLERAGYVTATASNGVEALRSIPTFHPHLVLSDRDMPEMDGMELCRKIKAAPALAGVFVVLISGTYTQSEEQAEGLESGADGYIPRPIANRELLARVESYIRIFRLQIQLSQARKMESVGQLACGMGHEINNPVMGIINYAQLIRDRLQGKNAALEGFAGEIIHEAERIAGIVRGLSAFAARDTTRRAEVNVGELIESALSPTRATLSHDHITLAVDVPDDLPAVSCDGRQIELVLTGLLSNARDALNEKYPGYDENKKIVISAKVVGDRLSLVSKQSSMVSDQSSIGSEQLSERATAASPITDHRSPITDHRSLITTFLRLTVEDHGTGIPAAVREHIFEPFFTTKDKSVGTGSIGKGLGLFVSYATVQDHGGSLTVESEPGQWTRFHVDLPVEANAEVRARKSEESA